MKTNKILLFLAGTVAFASCSLNDIPLDTMSPQAAFSDSTRVEYFINELYPYLNLTKSYNCLSGTGSFGGSMFECCSDLAAYSPTSQCGNVNLYIQGTVNAAAGGNPLTCWAEGYQGIRKCNVVLNNLKYATCSKAKVNRFRGEALLIKAIHHFDLIKRFGGIPIMDDLLDMSGDINIPRSSFEECIDYVVRLCDEAAEYLPTQYPANDYGRMTKGAAYGMKARALLYAASPLYNENPMDLSDYGYPELVKYAKPDHERWKLAADAALQVINLKNDDGTKAHQLYPDYKRYFFTREGNTESLVMKQQGVTNSVEKADGPSGYQNCRGNTDVTMELVNAFETKNGLLPQNDPAYDPQKPYANRDERFAANVLYSGAELWGRQVEYFKGGADYPASAVSKGCYTGFGMYKHIDPEATTVSPIKNTYHDWPILRYADVLLMYAEASNEYLGEDSDLVTDDLIYSCVNEVRARVHQPAVANLTKAQMRELIKRERTVEFCFEDLRYFDLRRWKDAEAVLNTPVHYAKVTKVGDVITYEYADASGKALVYEDRVFPTKMYYWPIPQTELNKNTALKKNPQW